ncbi:MAG: NeuB family protein [Euryarchaeota archaeon ADurb.Bin294]|jgi:N-acetylneuraminate synthase|nr:MAG: NeuB family protein [Euryarchaeota archaeon ADurb.Bin294]
MQIGRTIIGYKHSPFIIAEMSGNHNQSLDRALAIVEAAAETGANAIKLQTYTADTMTLDINEGEFFISDENNLWNGQSLYDLYRQAHTPWEWHAPIMKRAEELGLICFSTPFDETAVDFLENLNVPAYKIASFEIVDLPLIHRVASTGKPVIISTGMATIAEIDEAVRTARDAGCRDLILLKCTSTYPSSPENSNILTIPHMRELFGCEVGLSDHTLGVGAAIAAVAHGATVIEKHFTLSRADGGVDSAFSMEPNELRMLVDETKSARQSLGSVNYGPTEVEKNGVLRRRSLYIVKDMQAGDTFTRDNLRSIRPGLGLSPKYYDILLGRRVNRDVKKGTAVGWEIII